MRIQDAEILRADSTVRSEIVNYCIGAEEPQLEEGMQHFTIPFDYNKVYTNSLQIQS